MSERNIHTFTKSQDTIVTLVLFEQSYYINTFIIVKMTFFSQNKNNLVKENLLSSYSSARVIQS